MFSKGIPARTCNTSRETHYMMGAPARRWHPEGREGAGARGRILSVSNHSLLMGWVAGGAFIKLYLPHLTKPTSSDHGTFFSQTGRKVPTKVII